MFGTKTLCRCLKPLANIYGILLSWILLLLNFYVFFQLLNTADLKTKPVTLDELPYFSAEQGYQTLTNLGANGRNAYRLANYSDFILPILMFLSLSLPNIALGKDSRSILGPLACLISDYMENIAIKYVLDIYPQRNDFVMIFASYCGVIKFITFIISGLIVIVNIFRWIIQPNKRSVQKIE